MCLIHFSTLNDNVFKVFKLNTPEFSYSRLDLSFLMLKVIS